jgi:hypothetical protein
MASLLYLKGIEQAFLAAINFESDTIKAAWMSTSFTANAGTQSFWSDVSASAASGLTTQTLASKDIRIDTGNSRVEFDAADLSVGSQTGSTNKIVLYKDTGVAATSPLIACIDIAEGTLSPVAGTLAITFNSEGIFAISST